MRHTEQGEGVPDALFENVVGEVLVGQCPSKLNRASHHGEDTEHMRACRLGIVRGHASANVIDVCEQAAGERVLCRGWHAKLWDAAVDQLRFSADAATPGVWSFGDASVHANGMLGFAGLGRPFAFSDMMTKPRPNQWQEGPRLADAPHPEVLVAKAISDGNGLDVVLFPGDKGHRAGLCFDQLRPGRQYVAHGAINPHVTADAAGTAQVAVDVTGRTTIETAAHLMRPCVANETHKTENGNSVEFESTRVARRTHARG
jgi:hypothetical protein